MSGQDEMKLNPALVVQSMDTLAKQLALYEKEPTIHMLQALVVMQTKLSKIDEDMAATKHMIQILRSLSHYTQSPP